MAEDRFTAAPKTGERTMIMGMTRLRTPEPPPIREASPARRGISDEGRDGAFGKICASRTVPNACACGQDLDAWVRSHCPRCGKSLGEAHAGSIDRPVVRL
jgi:hypothetical protein